MRRDRLVVMAKQPRSGRVKTRLAHQIGSAEAVRVYRTILSSTLRNLSSDPRWQTWVAASPDTSVADPTWPATVCLRGQGSGDLGQRMQRVFDTMPRGPVVIIGSDIPGINRTDIALAFSALGGKDAVFGPAPDGGYWLVGQRRMPKVLALFADVRWSSEHALADTLANLRGYKTAMLRTIADVDEEADYRRWLRTQSSRRT